MHQSHHKFLGFQIPSLETGEPLYYCFSVLIYGLSPAVSLVTLLTKPIMQFFNKQGIRTSIFIDDGRTLGRNYSEAMNNHKFVLQTLQQAGWNIQFKKNIYWTNPIPLPPRLHHQHYFDDIFHPRFQTPRSSKQNKELDFPPHSKTILSTGWKTFQHWKSYWPFPLHHAPLLTPSYCESCWWGRRWGLGQLDPCPRPSFPRSGLPWSTHGWVQLSTYRKLINRLLSQLGGFSD